MSVLDESVAQGERPPPREEEAPTRLELIVAAADLGVWDWDVVTNDMRYSDRAKAICGFPLDKPVTFEQVRAATHPEDLPFTSAQARRALDPAIREHRPYEYRIVRPDGSIRWVIAHGEAVFEEEDGALRAVRYTGTIQDVTARKEMENELRANAARLRLALDASRLAVWELDLQKNTIETSPELNRMLGFKEDENPSIEDIRARYYPGEMKRLRDIARQSVERGERYFEVEFRYIWPDKSVRWLLVRAEIVAAPDGTPQSAIGVLQDITERKEREQHTEFLLHELSHRSKNLLAVVQGMARQTIRHAASPRDFEHALLGRLQALARAHDLLLREDWRGAEIGAVIATQLEGFEIDPERIGIEGPRIFLSSNAAQDLGVSIYELATNALKYGALSDNAGRVSVSWRIEGTRKRERTLHIAWTESGGPPVGSPERRGFGSIVLGRGGRSEAASGPTLEFAPEGVRWTRKWNEPEFSPR